MSNTLIFTTTKGKAAGGQDKDRQSGDRPASSRAYRNPAAAQSNTAAPQSSDHDSDPYALVPLTIQCRRYVKREIQEIAKRRSTKQKEKVSDSSVGAELLEQIVHHQANLRHTAFLEPVLTKLFERKFTEFFDRYLGIAARNTYNLHRVLTILLNFVPLYVDSATFQEILDEAEVSKRVDITRQSEQVKEVYNILRQEVLGEEEGV
jgi:hypothetical protein